MLAAEYDILRRVEDSHWWHAVLRRQVLNALTDASLPPRVHLLDAGCGTGGMLAFLQEKCPNLDTVGIDASELAVRHCHVRGLRQVRQGSVHALPFAADAFDVVLSLDVLYHSGVEEEQALAEMCRVLRPGGLLVLNLPAFACLRGSHDVAVCGVRRYTASHVRRMLNRHSLTDMRTNYWNAWLFLPLLAWRRMSRLQSEEAESAAVSDLILPPPWLNRCLALVGQMDVRLCRLLRLPFGSSVFAVARKPVQAGGTAL
ncbi:MAG: class I SAM-dependent methyltransferase [Prosthecobacter sp.]|nr:class I SAM-dependent methyltransferase [Prosthecobacter sp.]